MGYKGNDMRRQADLGSNSSLDLSCLCDLGQVNQLFQASILSLEIPQSDSGRSKLDAFMPKGLVIVLGTWQIIVSMRCY